MQSAVHRRNQKTTGRQDGWTSALYHPQFARTTSRHTFQPAEPHHRTLWSMCALLRVPFPRSSQGAGRETYPPHWLSPPQRNERFVQILPHELINLSLIYLYYSFVPAIFLLLSCLSFSFLPFLFPFLLSFLSFFFLLSFVSFSLRAGCLHPFGMNVSFRSFPINVLICLLFTCTSFVPAIFLLLSCLSFSFLPFLFPFLLFFLSISPFSSLPCIHLSARYCARCYATQF